MKNLEFDCVVIGSGVAGLASSLTIANYGWNVAAIDRESDAGGILPQCIHNGFGLLEFGEQLTGPEYAERFYTQVMQHKNIKTFFNTTVLQIDSSQCSHTINCASPNGVLIFHTRAVVLAMGCRERNRGNIGTAGDRPSGVFTAGLAQRLINIDGYIPGKDVVIIGSGDIGLIMARRMTWSGSKVHAVVELQSFPNGLTRNIVQCLNDFDIPLYLSHIVSRINGQDRVESVDVTPLVDGKADYTKTFNIKCDTVLLSVGLVPENELSKNVGITLNPVTNGPIVDSHLMTSVGGIFACGNVLHVHDLADFVTRESRRAGEFVNTYLSTGFNSQQIDVNSGHNVRYVCPNKVDLSGDNQIFLRSLIKSKDKNLNVIVNNITQTRQIKSVKLAQVQPSEMITLVLKKNELSNIEPDDKLIIKID